MKNHPITSQTLSAFVDGELSAREMARVKEHLDRCSACRDEVTALRRVSGLVRSARIEEEIERRLEGFSDRVQEKIQRAGSKGTIWSRFADRWFGVGSVRRWSPVYSLAVVAVAVIAIGVSIDLTRWGILHNVMSPPREVACDLEVETGLDDANIIVLSNEGATVVWVQGPEGA
jgi:anti-sigma factor RsiW